MGNGLDNGSQTSAIAGLAHNDEEEQAASERPDPGQLSAANRVAFPGLERRESWAPGSRKRKDGLVARLSES